MIDLSVIIPSRNGQPYLQKTIDDLIAKAEGEIEVIVVCDGIWPNPLLTPSPKVKIIHHGTVHDHKGMRESINKGISIASGKYIMKCDEHCMFDKGFDRKLIADCADNWVVIPRRYRLEPDEWKLIEDGRPPIDYMYLAYPYERPFDRTCGLHGAEDKQRAKDRANILIDDTMSWQGSCYFTTKAYWDKLIGDLDTEHYGTFTQEAQEIGNKVWLSGGRLVVNKKTWYAHMHKGQKGKGYGFSTEQYVRHQSEMELGRLYCIDYWVSNKHLADHPDWKPFEYLLEKFWPVPTWPQNWKEQIEIDKQKDYSTLKEKNNPWLKGIYGPN